MDSADFTCKSDCGKNEEGWRGGRADKGDLVSAAFFGTARAAAEGRGSEAGRGTSAESEEATGHRAREGKEAKRSGAPPLAERDGLTSCQVGVVSPSSLASCECCGGLVEALSEERLRGVEVLEL